MAMADRDLGVGESEVAIFFGRKSLAGRLLDGAEHSIVKDFPRSKLLAEHLSPCGFQIHCFLRSALQEENGLEYGV